MYYWGGLSKALAEERPLGQYKRYSKLTFRFLAGRRPRSAVVHSVKIEGTRLVLEISGLEELEALARRVEVDLCDVEEVVDDVGGWEGLRGRLSLKLAGADVPGHLIEGRYLLRGGGLAFVAVRDPSRALAIRLRGGRYREVIFDVDDKQAVLELIREAMSSCGRS